LEHPAAPGRTFLVADGEDLSTPSLIRRLAAALDRRARLVALPPALLRVGARLAGRGAEFDRLAGDLAVDSAAIRATLGWRPVQAPDDALAETAAWFRRRTAAGGARPAA